MATTRERRVWNVMWTFLSVTLLLTALVLAVRLLGARHPSDFLNGMELGLLTVLPVGMGLLLYRAYQQMDEYARRVQERAAATGFLLSMIATMVCFAASSLAHLSVPLWVIYVFGMLVYGASVAVQSRRSA
jgi:hypothetical protein